MTQWTHGASDFIGQRIRQVRRRRGWSASELAQRCTDNGVPMTRQAVSNIENGRPGQDGVRRRQITAEELLGFSLVLGVAPVHLLVPTMEGENYPITATRNVASGTLREWVRGSTPLPLSDSDNMIWLTERPQTEIKIMPGDESGEAAE